MAELHSHGTILGTDTDSDQIWGVALNRHDIELIEEVLRDVRAVGDKVADDFYTTLFEIDPGVRELFSIDLAAQRRKFADELQSLGELAVSMLDADFDQFEIRASELGRRHAGYGTSPGHYPAVGEALLAALERNVAGWQEAHRAAWERLYLIVATAMIEAARQPE